MKTHPLFTVGHSNHPIDRFLALLQQHGIAAVFDVRSIPFSRRHPQFSQDNLRRSLSVAGIQYVFRGKELGARRNEPEAYDGQVASYELIAQLPLFQLGLDRVREGNNQYRLALMCAENDPLQCHRTVLVCRHLRDEFKDQLFHILGSGELEPHDALEKRLLAGVGIDAAQDDLFQDNAGESVLDHAYRMRGMEMAYQVKNCSSPDAM